MGQSTSSYKTNEESVVFEDTFISSTEQVQYPTYTKVGNRFVMKVRTSSINILEDEAKAIRKGLARSMGGHPQKRAARHKGSTTSSSSYEIINMLGSIPIENEKRFHPFLLHFYDPAFEKAFRKHSATKFLKNLEFVMKISLAIIFPFLFFYVYIGNMVMYSIVCVYIVSICVALIVLRRIKHRCYSFMWAMTFSLAVITLSLAFTLRTNTDLPILIALSFHIFSVLVRHRTTYYIVASLSLTVIYTGLSSMYLGIDWAVIYASPFAMIAVSYGFVSYFYERTDRIIYSSSYKKNSQRKTVKQLKSKTRQILHTIYPRDVASKLLSSSDVFDSEDFFISSDTAYIVSIKMSLQHPTELLESDEDILTSIQNTLQRIGFEIVFQSATQYMFVANLFPTQRATDLEELIREITKETNITHYFQNADRQSKMCISISQGCAFGGVYLDQIGPLCLYGRAIETAQRFSILQKDDGLFMDSVLALRMWPSIKIHRGVIRVDDLPEFIQIINRSQNQQRQSIILERSAMLPNLADLEDIHEEGENDTSKGLDIAFTEIEEANRDMNLTAEDVAIIKAASTSRGRRERTFLTTTYVYYISIVSTVWGFFQSTHYSRFSEAAGTDFNILAILRYLVFTPLILALGASYFLGVQNRVLKPQQADLVYQIPTYISSLYLLFSYTFHFIWAWSLDWGCMVGRYYAVLNVEDTAGLLFLAMSPSVRMNYLRGALLSWFSVMIFFHAKTQTCGTSSNFMLAALMIMLHVIAPIILLRWAYFTRRNAMEQQKMSLRKMEMENLSMLKMQKKMESIALGLLPNSVYQSLQNEVLPEQGHARDASFILVYFESFDSVDHDTSRNATSKEAWSFITDLLRMIDGLAQTVQVEPIKSLGQTYLLWCGWDGTRKNHLELAIHFSHNLQMILEDLYLGYKKKIVQARICVSVGECRYGFAGTNRISFDVWGPSCDDAYDMLPFCPTGQVLVTSAVKSRMTDKRQFCFDKFAPIDQDNGAIPEYYSVRVENDLWHTITSAEIHPRCD